MTGPLAQQFAQLGGTLDFLREIENGTRCGTCQRPHATDDDWQRYDEGEGEHLCWETVCSHEPESPTALERLVESRGGLSAIERHVQDMEKALRDFAEHGTRFDTNPTRIVPTDPVSLERDSWWANRAHEMDKNVRRRARAALSAREKGTE